MVARITVCEESDGAGENDFSRAVADGVVQEGSDMQSEQVRVLFSTDASALGEDAVYADEVSKKPVNQPFAVLRRNFHSLIRSVKESDALQHAFNTTERAEDGTPDGGEQGLKSQINDRDREHLETFPAHRKAQVMEKILSRTPAKSEVHHGKNHFEKAVLKIRRDGFRLIDLQPLETALTTVWYRKGRSFLGMGADVTMVLWEHGEHDHSDLTTIMTWRI